MDGFMNIFSHSRLSAGLMDMQALLLKIATPAIWRTLAGDQLFHGKVDRIARRSIVCKFINKNIEARPRLGSNWVLFLFSKLTVYTLEPIFSTLFPSDRDLLINDQRDLQLLAVRGNATTKRGFKVKFVHKTRKKTSIRERKRKVKNSPRPRHLHLEAILSPS